MQNTIMLIFVIAMFLCVVQIVLLVVYMGLQLKKTRGIQESAVHNVYSDRTICLQPIKGLVYNNNFDCYSECLKELKKVTFDMQGAVAIANSNEIVLSEEKFDYKASTAIRYGENGNAIEVFNGALAS